MPTPWTTRIWQEFRAGNLSRAERDCLLTLHTYRGTGGVAWPSHATLADRSHTSPSTVARALKQAAHLGLLSWVERRVRAGWRWLRTSNLYRFLTPDSAVRGYGLAWQCQPLTCQDAGGGERVSKKDALATMLQAARAMPDLLAMRRTVMEGRLAAR